MTRWSPADLAEAMSRNSGLRVNRDSAFKGSVPHQAGRLALASETGIRPERGGKAANSSPSQPLSFTVLGAPVPKPRQTRSDKWKKRPSVLRYRAWADEARRVYGEAKRRQFPDVRFLGEIRYSRIMAIAFFKMPGSWNAVTRAKMKGQPHTLRPDADNILKSVADSLFPTGDEHLYSLSIEKRWDDGNGARTVITLY